MPKNINAKKERKIFENFKKICKKNARNIEAKRKEANQKMI